MNVDCSIHARLGDQPTGEAVAAHDAVPTAYGRVRLAATGPTLFADCDYLDRLITALTTVRDDLAKMVTA